MTPRDRRAIAIGLAAVGIAIAARATPRLVERWREGAARLEAQRALLAETRRAIADLPQMEDSARTLTTAVASLAPRILGATTESAAIAELSGRVSTIAGRHHGRMVSITPAPDTAVAGPLRRATGTVDLETDFRGLAGILAEFGRDTVVTVVERLEATAEDPLGAETTPERLRVRVVLTAWYLTREGTT